MERCRFLLPFTILFLAISYPNPVFPAPAFKPVLLSTDAGDDPDDDWALAYIAHSRELNLVGVVSAQVPGFENSATDTASRAFETAAFLKDSNRLEIIAGSNVPVQPSLARHPQRERPGAKYIVEKSRPYKNHRLTVLVIGPATDVALAVLIDPSIVERVEIIALAFDRWPPGSEGWNVKADPRAWEILLRSAAPLVLATEDVALRDLTMGRDEVRKLLSGTGCLGRYLGDLFRDWTFKNSQYVKAKTGRDDSWPIWDLAAVAYLFGFVD